MKKVYVAGAFSADNVIDVLKNIGKGEYFAARLFLMGYAVYVPWWDKDIAIKFPYVEYKDGQFYNHSIEWLKVSDAIFVTPNYENSKGTLKEIEIAKDLGIPIFYDIESLNEWARKEK